LADLIVGAVNSVPAGRSAAGRSYVIFGSTTGLMVNSYVDQMGTDNDDSLTSLGSQTLIGGAGNDTFHAYGADVLYGGMGNDLFVLNSSVASSTIRALQGALGINGNIAQLARIDGGSGIDTIQLTGANTTLDLTQVSNQSASDTPNYSRISSIERIDMLTDTSSQILKLGLQDVLDMSGMNVFNTNNGWSNIAAGIALTPQVMRHQMVITGNSNDTLQFAESAANWVQAGQVTYGSHTYTVYNHNAALAQLIIESAVVVPII